MRVSSWTLLQRSEVRAWASAAPSCTVHGTLRVMSTERVVGVGAGAAGFDPAYERGGAGTDLPTTDMVLNIGPQHPATHGVLRLRLTLDGERIAGCEPIIGYMHRGAEKLFEVRDYRQIIVLANRHDWLSAFANELGVVIAVERMMNLEVPERAVWLRTLLAELNRVLNHLMFLGSYPLELGAITPVFYAFRERETIQAVMEELSGGRMHYMFNRVGGLRRTCRTAGSAARPPPPPPSASGCPTSRRSSSATRSSAPGPSASASSPPNSSRSTACPARSRVPPESTPTCAATSLTSRTATCRTYCEW